MISEPTSWPVSFTEDTERAMLALPQVPCPVKHHFYPGIYMREVSLPAGTIAVGHYQTQEHVNILAKGCVTMILDDGTRVTLTAPLTFNGRPGRKVGYIHEDVTWFNVYPTNETDIETLEKTYLNKSEAFKNAEEQDKSIRCFLANNDYVSLLGEMGVTQESVDVVVKNEADMIPMPHGSYKWQLGPSAIHGKGVFAVGEYGEGEEIGAARIGDKRTPLGRYVNHAKDANAVAIFDEPSGNVYFHAKRRITGNDGGLLGEEITLDYRGPLGHIHKIQFT